jgi:hypothetical protein
MRYLSVNSNRSLGFNGILTGIFECGINPSVLLQAIQIQSWMKLRHLDSVFLGTFDWSGYFHHNATRNSIMTSRETNWTSSTGYTHTTVAGIFGFKDCKEKVLEFRFFKLSKNPDQTASP